MKKTFYVTTPIYYPSDKLHIGHAYTTVAADVLARYKKLRDFDVMFLTGTDEHGQKIEKVAAAVNKSPKEYTDEIVLGIKELWELLEIDYDIFIRTTDEPHKKAVQKIFKQLYEQGDIYKSKYEGKYCTHCETFFTDHQLVDGKCPDCSRAVEMVVEESYFFKLSAYQDRLIKHIEENPKFILPETRQKEMINNFLKPGLEDLCVSRTSFKWGIPVDFDPDHVVYVWIDALSNYISALGYGTENDENFKKYWPADVHLIGKEIVRFHCIIWPAILMALGEELPKQIFGHGWLVVDGGKMSKSVGNVVDPKFLVESYGLDAIRYFLMREIAFGQDGNFSNEALLQRINADLANDLGNLLSRTVGMIDKYFGGTITAQQEGNEFDADLEEKTLETVEKVEEAMDNLMFSDALTHIWTLIRRTNKYIDETKPWELAKVDSEKPKLSNIMYKLAETLRVVSILISPVILNMPKKIYEQLNIDNDELKTWESTKILNYLPREVKITKGEIVFPRIDIKLEMEKLELAREEMRKNSIAYKMENETKNEEVEKEETGLIDIADFEKVKFCVGEVIECEKVPKSDKLLKSQVKIGGQVKQIVSGIAEHYSPEEMIGKKLVVVTNLKPVKLRGTLSEGMILAASKDGVLKLVTVEDGIESGAEVK